MTNKTVETQLKVSEFLASIADENRRRDCKTVAELMKKITGKSPKMWGPSIVGFGRYHYKYDSGREGDFFWAGFSPRKQALTLYLMGGYARHNELMKKLGKYKAGKGCLYVKSLEDIDMTVLEKLIVESVAYIRTKYPD